MRGYAALRRIMVMGLGPCRAVDAPADAHSAAVQPDRRRCHRARRVTDPPSAGRALHRRATCRPPPLSSTLDQEAQVLSHIRLEFVSPPRYHAQRAGYAMPLTVRHTDIQTAAWRSMYAPAASKAEAETGTHASPSEFCQDSVRLLSCKSALL